MAHVLVLVEGRETWMNVFLNDLLKRRYPYTMMNGQMGMIQPNPREVKLFDISIPEESISFLMEDLAPFAGSHGESSVSKTKAKLLADVLGFSAGLNPIGLNKKTRFYSLPVIGKVIDRFLRYFKPAKFKGFKPSNEVRKQWVNIMPIGWKEDPKDPNSPIVNLPKGGELI